MLTFLARRILFMLLTLFIVSIIVFTVSELGPGNIAINTLGNTITPAQEASFNAQNGLDQPALTRYVRWLVGSDWQVARLVGMPVQRFYDRAENRYTWWGVKPDGVLVQHYTTDGETMTEVQRLPDGSQREVPLGPEVWQPNDEGIPVFWGIERESRAAMWVRGDKLEQWTLTKATWTSAPGAPRQYIPLQQGLLRGDPGVSFYTRRPVAETLIPRLLNTLLLSTLAFVVIMPIAVVLGLIAGLNEGRLVDRVLSIGDARVCQRRLLDINFFGLAQGVAWLGRDDQRARHFVEPGATGVAAADADVDRSRLCATHHARGDGRGDAYQLHPHRRAQRLAALAHRAQARAAERADGPDHGDHSACQLADRRHRGGRVDLWLPWARALHHGSRAVQRRVRRRSGGDGAGCGSDGDATRRRRAVYLFEPAHPLRVGDKHGCC
jgi:hypothetical protein